MKVKRALPGLFFLLVSTVGYAEVAVIVNPKNSNILDERDIRKIYLGKSKTYPDGSKAEPLEFSAGSTTRDEFLVKVLKKDEATLNSHWARMLFSSKAQPPKPVTSVAEMKSQVAANPAAIGYIDAAQVDGSVKVLLRIN